MEDFQELNKLALVTGATGGIGLSFAGRLASEGYDLVITGRNSRKLAETTQNLRDNNPGINIEAIVADLSVAADISSLVKYIQASARVDILVNCAGYGERSLFNDEQEHEILDMLSVHITATVQLVHAVLPLMMKQHSGAIITVSSLAAFVPAPGASIYSSSKAFLNTFMESLHMELHQYGIKVQSLCPGPTHTDFHNGVDVAQSVSGIDVWMEPDEVVEISLRALEKSEVICIPGGVNKMLKNLASVLPRKPYYILAEKMARKFRGEDKAGDAALSGKPA